MGDDDIALLAFAEKNSSETEWELQVTFKGDCLLGCKTRKMLNTKNMVKALDWVEYHRNGPEHVAAVFEKVGRTPLGALPPIHGTISGTL